MKNCDILHALNDVDFDMIEDAGRVTRKSSIRRRVARWSSLAACVCVVLVGALLLSLLGERPIVDFIDHTIFPQENLWVPEYDSSGIMVEGGTSGDLAPATVAYERGFGVVAKVVEILPDIYADMGLTTQYHILKLEILEVLYGENMPKEIYFRLHSRLDPSLDEYDCIVFGGMSQVGFENYAMVNVSQKQVEEFTLLFECWGYYANHGAILPFKNGIFSLEHWKKEGWYNGDWENLRINNFSFGDSRFPARDGCTLLYTKLMIKMLRAGNSPNISSDRVITRDVFATEEQREILAYVGTPENGLFVQGPYVYCNSGSVMFTRAVGGFLTNELIHMTDEGKVNYRGERFTKEDLANIQDLGAFIATIDLEALVPPHTPGYEELEKSQSLTAKYVKHQGVVYGVVRIVWTLKQEAQWWYDTVYYKDVLYYLVMPDGTSRIVEYSELVEYIGDDSIAIEIKYGVDYNPGVT